MKINARFQNIYPYLIFISFTAFLLLRMLIIFSEGTDIAGIEQNVIYSTQMLIDNGHLYARPSEAPFSITQYTPLYYYLCSFTAKMTRHTASDISALYVIGRSWNLLFNIITAFLVFKIGRSVFSLSKNKAYFLFLLSFAITFSHNFAVRPDSLGDMLGISAIYSFLQFQKYQKTTLLVITVFLTAASFFSKQSGIQLILIFGGFCLLNKDWKSLIKMIIFSMLIYSALTLIFRYLYPSFFQNVIGGVVNGINIQNFIKFIITKPVFILSVWPLVFLSLFIIIKKNALFKGSAAERFLAISVVGTLVFATVTALKMGSTVQYYILFINLSLLLIITRFQQLAITESSLQPINFNTIRIAFNCFLTLIILIYGAYDVKLIINFDYNPKLEKQRNAAKKTAEYIRQNSIKNSGRYIFANLTTDTTIPSRQSLNNIFFNNCLVPQMDILEYSTGPSKVIGYQQLENMLINGEVEYIIESSPPSKFSIISNLTHIRVDKFKLVNSIAGYQIYRFSLN